MSKFRIYNFKIRALLFANLQKVFGFLLHIPVPPKVSAGCFIEKNGKYLAVDLTYRKGVAIPGGLIEPQENVEKCVQREVMEETGLSVSNLQYIGSQQDIQYGLTVIALAFSGTVSGQTHNSDEGNLVWLTARELREQLSYPNWKILLDLYQNK